jgi:hypothetical protein
VGHEHIHHSFLHLVSSTEGLRQDVISIEHGILFDRMLNVGLRQNDRMEEAIVICTRFSSVLSRRTTKTTVFGNLGIPLRVDDKDLTST